MYDCVGAGNEQYNGDYIAQVKAMEERANQVGQPPQSSATHVL